MYSKLSQSKIDNTKASGIIGSKVMYFDTLTSTFDKIRTLPDSCGLTVVCSHQSAGVGRMGRTWESSEGGVYFTFSLTHSRSDFEIPFITAVCALGVCNILNDYIPCEIKWPNDIVSGGRKLCGILTKNLVADGSVTILVGIGINANNSFSDSLPYAASVAGISGNAVDENRLLRDVLNEIDRIYYTMPQDEILAAYKANCINLGKEVTLDFGSRAEKGICTDIMPDGSMEYETDGVRHIVFSGEVSVKGIYTGKEQHNEITDI